MKKLLPILFFVSLNLSAQDVQKISLDSLELKKMSYKNDKESGSLEQETFFTAGKQVDTISHRNQVTVENKANNVFSRSSEQIRADRATALEREQEAREAEEQLAKKVLSGNIVKTGKTDNAKSSIFSRTATDIDRDLKKKEEIERLAKEKQTEALGGIIGETKKNESRKDPKSIFSRTNENLGKELEEKKRAEEEAKKQLEQTFEEVVTVEKKTPAKSPSSSLFSRSAEQVAKDNSAQKKLEKEAERINVHRKDRVKR